MIEDDWKLNAPCRNSDPALFDIPGREDKAGWEQLRVTAEKWCRACPLMQVCAADPDSRYGLWGGSARWTTAKGTRVEALVAGAPVPQFDRRSRMPSFAEWISPTRRAAS